MQHACKQQPNPAGREQDLHWYDPSNRSSGESYAEIDSSSSLATSPIQYDLTLIVEGIPVHKTTSNSQNVHKALAFDIESESAYTYSSKATITMFGRSVTPR
jgi:hypothetical protein